MSLIECLKYIHSVLSSDTKDRVWEWYENLCSDQTYLDKWHIDCDSSTTVIGDHTLCFKENSVFITPNLTVQEANMLLIITQDKEFVRYCCFYNLAEIFEYDYQHLKGLKDLDLFNPLNSFYDQSPDNLCSSWLEHQLENSKDPVLLMSNILDNGLLYDNKALEDDYDDNSDAPYYDIRSTFKFSNYIKQSSYDNVMVLIYYHNPEIGQTCGQKITQLFKDYDLWYTYLNTRLDLITPIYSDGLTISVDEITRQVLATPTREEHVKKIVRRETYAEIYLEQHLIPDIVKNIMKYLITATK